jgi:hypothetical protein
MTLILAGWLLASVLAFDQWALLCLCSAKATIKPLVFRQLEPQCLVLLFAASDTIYQVNGYLWPMTGVEPYALAMRTLMTLPTTDV